MVNRLRAGYRISSGVADRDAIPAWLKAESAYLDSLAGLPPAFTADGQVTASHLFRLPGLL